MSEPEVRDLREEGIGGDTWLLITGHGAMHRVGSCFRTCFGAKRGFLVVDDNTWKAAGDEVVTRLGFSGVPVDSLVFYDNPVPAVMDCVDRVQASLAKTDAIPVAVGSEP